VGNSREKAMEGTWCNLSAFGGNWSASNIVQVIQIADG
jgi:hypothetical protein